MKTQLAGIPQLPDGHAVELYRIALKSGLILYATSRQIAAVWAGNTYLADQLLISRSMAKTISGHEVQECDLTIAAKDGNSLFNGVTFPNLVNQGGLDGAEVTIWRARQAYTVHLFQGIISAAVADRTQAEIKVSEPKIYFNIQMPLRIWQPQCSHTVYDDGCTVNRAAFTTAASVAAGSTKTLINSGLGNVAHYYSLGEIIFTSGANAGLKRGIRSYTPGVISLYQPLLADPGIGDTFTAVPGCNNIRSTCKDVFSNEPNFNGATQMPKPETSL